MKYFVLCFTILMLFSCKTQDEYIKDVKPISEVYIEDVEQLIETGDYLKAVQDISFLRRENKTVDKATLKELETTLYGEIKHTFSTFTGESNFEEALSLYRSLYNIGREDFFPEWSERKLLFEIARHHESKKNFTLACYYYTIILTRYDDVSEEEYRGMLEIAYDLKNYPVLALVIRQMEAKGFIVGEEYKSLLTKKVSKAKMMDGTAVIWVDKGIKIENGYGVPDTILGSGFFVDENGYMITNHHVIESEVDPTYEGFSRLYVRLSKSVDEKIPAKVVGYDRIFDVALLKTGITPDYVFYSAGNEEAEPGDKVMAIGAPLGLENTLTSGIVSNLSRRFIQMGDVMQIDAPVNPGNSGGPLLNENDKLLGIVFAGLEQFEGLNFAIPYNWVNKIFPSLFKEGEVLHPWLGLALDENDEGLEVIYAVPGEPAWQAGIKKGDIILELNGQEYTSIRDFQEGILDYSEESLVTLTWDRDGERTEGIICTTERPYSPVELALKKDIRNNIIIPVFGMEIEAVKNFLWETEYVVKRVYQGSIADNSGISEKDPLSIKKWHIDLKRRIIVLQVFVKKRNSGFFESLVQLASYLETDNFI